MTPNAGEDAEEPRMLLVGTQNVLLWDRKRLLTKVNTPSPGNPAIYSWAFTAEERQIFT